MRKVGGLIVMSALVVAALLTTAAQQPGGRLVRLRGVVTDSMCGAKHMISGDDAKCVRTCVKGGSHYALLVGEKVYELSGRDAELDRLAGSTVDVAGTVDDKGTVDLASVRPVAHAPATTSLTKPSQDDAALDRPVTVRGLVRDVACPIQNHKTTAKTFNLKCALACVKLGSPIILLTDDGTMYTPISASMPDQDLRPRLIPFVGKYVEIRGQVFERQGTRAIMIQDITEVKGVHLVTDAE